MNTITTQREHKTRATMPRCDTCHAPATHGTWDNKEVTSTTAYRAFEEMPNEKRGCSAHPVMSLTRYLDGRVIPTRDCVEELVSCPQEQT